MSTELTNHASSDYEAVRDNLYSMLAEAKHALEIAKEILRESEHPRAVETYSNLLNNVTKLNTQILELSKIHKDITERKSYKDAGNTPALPNDDKSEERPVNVFIGNTADLQEMLKEARQQTEDIIDMTPEND